MTVQDVAATCGVSAMTVSRVMRGIDGVGSETRARVEHAIDALGYVPNGNAQALAAADSRLIGISLPNLFNDVFADVLEGMRRTLLQSGYASVVDTTDYDPERELEWVRRMVGWRPAALILTGCLHDPALRDLVARAGIPVLEMWDVTDDPIDLCVGIDHRAAAEALGRHVVALGYRRPAFVGTPEGLDPRADARAAGLADAFRGAGTSLARLAADGESAFDTGARGFGARPADADVVFFHNDNGAFGGIIAAEAAGLTVPHDIGIVGFNGLQITKVMRRPLTTMETPRRQIGLTAAHRLLARLNGVRPSRVTALPCRLVPGATIQMQ
ncbi:LacI family DNA-binding transcriptional regulator [Jannaschia sp.]|nr:LacI family DNA-binding transcriptional regulator [Jannaschia sp.]